MATEETTAPSAVPDGSVFMSKEDYAKIGAAMEQYKQIELAYLKMRAVRVRLVVITFMFANAALFGGLWLAFTGWQKALAWAILAFAGEEAFMASITYLVGQVRRGT